MGRGSESGFKEAALLLIGAILIIIETLEISISLQQILLKRVSSRLNLGP